MTMNALRRHATLGLLLSTLSLSMTGCLASEQPAPDSETHFLRACDTSCGDGLTCICGVCSAACDPARDCSAQHPDASCVTLDAFADGDSCNGDTAPGAVCELECDGDADCADLSDEHTCEAGRCRAPKAKPTKPAPGTCEYDGKTYAVGDSFPAGDGCNSCACTEDGEAACTLIGCGPNEPGTCEYDGKTYRVGDSFPSSDGCNDCSCDGDDQVGCTERACAPRCEYNGVTYVFGDTFMSSDGCNKCQCLDTGEVACDDADCSGGCEYNGQFYAVGDSFPSDDGCNTCSCGMDGLVACTLRACVPGPGPVGGACSAPFDGGSCDGVVPVFWHNPDTGLCEAKTYGGCEGNENRYDTLADCMAKCGGAAATACKVLGKVYPHGSAVPDPFSCNMCTCDNGQVTGCTEIACETPCPPTHKPGTSCAQCGPADGCEVLETGCMPVCSGADECTNDPEYFFCVTSENYCASLCG